jgi:hypothetical protein
MEMTRSSSFFQLTRSSAAPYGAAIYTHPSDVTSNPKLTTAEKRAVLASWISDARAVENVRCFFMKHGHITAVELLPGLNDEEAVKRSHELFAARKNEAGYEGFEVWEQARMIIQYLPVSSRSKSEPRRGGSASLN